ncbi:hypothetical protein KKC60_05780 [Patescibacteria group bacterium]|nr:hypothetical protein [Patescibacteria group bacterium]
MDWYQCRKGKLAGTSYGEVRREAIFTYQEIRKSTKRRPYIRSKYFLKQKIFLDLFWKHLYEKNLRDRTRRLKFFPAAIDLMQNTALAPESKDNPNHSNETLHRFTGLTLDQHMFYVHIRENKRNGNKSMFSVFPEQNPDKFF